MNFLNFTEVKLFCFIGAMKPPESIQKMEVSNMNNSCVEVVKKHIAKELNASITYIVMVSWLVIFCSHLQILFFHLFNAQIDLINIVNHNSCCRVRTSWMPPISDLVLPKCCWSTPARKGNTPGHSWTIFWWEVKPSPKMKFQRLWDNPNCYAFSTL